LIDAAGKKRIAGEKWVHRVTGYYLPQPEEEVLDVWAGHVLNEYKALYMRARQTFTDFQGNLRKAG